MRKYSKILYLLISTILLLSTSVNSQTQVDSLLIELDQTHEISNKIDIYLKISKQYGEYDLTKAIHYTENALLLAQKTNADSLLGLIYSYLGTYSILQDSIEDSEEYFNLAKDYLDIRSKPDELISIYLLIGNRFVEKDRYADAMKYYLTGIDISEQTNHQDKLPNLYNNLGIVYLNINNAEKALTYYSKALELFKESNDTMNVAGTTTNIGSIYIRLGQNEIAKTYYQSGFKLFSEIFSLEGMAHSLLKLGLLDLLQKDYYSAIEQLEKSLMFQKELEITVSGSKSFFLAETYINLGIAYLKSKDYNQAITYLLEGYGIAKSTSQYRLVELSSKHIAEYYQKLEDYSSALNYYQIFKQYSDSTFNEESVRKLTQIEMQYEFNAKLKEDKLERTIQIQNEKRKNLIYIIVSIGLFLSLVIFGLLLRLEKIKKRQMGLEKDNLSTRLEHTNKELTTYVMYLLRKNEFIISIAEKLKVARLDAKAENKKVMTELIKELESNSSMISWEEFEVRFQQVYTGFYKKLNTEYPDLSPNELRLCAFFRLNMTTKEIAAITYQSINSISVARYRLRKKLGINSDDNLVAFLTKM